MDMAGATFARKPDGSVAAVAGSEQWLDLFERMLTIRQFEQMAYLRFLQGEIPGTLHQSQGQEAVAVGVCSMLRSTDWITSTHRPHGHALAKGMDPNVAMAEVYGKAPGCMGGRGGSMHLGDPGLGILPSTAIVGGGLTLAPGLALALARAKEGGVVACFFGDGAVNEGAFHEGVNFAAVKHLPVIFVCENNGYGASTPFVETTLNTNVASKAQAYGIPGEQVDGMDVLAVQEAATRAIARARDGKGPTILECITYRYVGHSRGDARGYRTKDEENTWKSRDPIPRLRARIVAEGQASEDHVAAAERRAKDRIAEAIRFAQDAPMPDPAGALDLSKVYAALPVRPQAPAGPLEEGSDDRMLTIAEALHEGIEEEMASDDGLVLLGEDVGVPGGFGGAFGLYLGLAERFGRDRVIDTPISEKAIIGASIGGAIAGLRTLPDLQYADFIYESMDELVNEAAMLRFMSDGKLSVPMVLRSPVGSSQRGSQHSQCPESLFMHTPGLKVLCISDAYTAKAGIKAALRDPDPVLVFEHKLLYGAKRREAGSIGNRAYVPEGDYTIPLGQARIRRRGDDVTIVATFLQLYAALDVAEELAQEGISCEVIDPVWLAPFDWDAVIESVRRTTRLVTAHEAHLTGGWGAEVAARVGTELHGRLAAPIVRLATPDVHVPFTPSLERVLLPRVEQVRDAVRSVMRDPAAAA